MIEWNSKADGNGKPCRQIVVGKDEVLNFEHHKDWEITVLMYPDYYPVDKLIITIERKARSES